MLGGLLIAGAVLLFAVELAPLLLKYAELGNATHVQAVEAARAGCLRAVADLHGDVQQAEKALRLLNVVDASGSWSAGGCTLVQTGDIVDRGPDSLPLLKRFATLAKQAEAAGGRVILLYGNHELMNIQGDFRYMNPQELEALGKDADDDVLQRLPPFYKRMATMISRGRSRALQKGTAVWAGKLLPDAPLGKYLRAHRQAAAVVGEGVCRTLFVHAGLLPDSIKAAERAAASAGAPGSAVEALNAVVAGALARCDGAAACPGPGEHQGVAYLLSDGGVFWTRAYAHWPDAQLCPQVAAVLDAVGARQAVVGHTPQESPKTRCGGKVHLIDVGISRAYVGGMAAWSCENGAVKHLA